MSVKNKYDKQHLKNIQRYSKQIESIYDAAAKEAAAISGIVSNFDPSKPFSFVDYPITKHRLDKLLSNVSKQAESVIINGIKAEWEVSNIKNDELVRDSIDKIWTEKRGAQNLIKNSKRYFQNNERVCEAFIARKEQGLDLSDRVWKYADQFKQEIEMGIDLGLRDGKSAEGIGRDLRQYLQQPDKLFRRVRDKHGQLHLSKKAAAYHPGAGMYRSSRKNALRLARTETNIAYRTSDFTRWQQLDFVVGIEIKASNNHPAVDICDSLNGKYPKDFKFSGWHPQCFCYAIPILKTMEEMQADNERIMNGEQVVNESTNSIRNVPADFNKWIADNKERISRAKSLPYFVRDNEKYFTKIDITDSAMKGVKEARISNDIIDKKLTSFNIAKQRHAARPPEQIEDIKNRWRSRHASVIMGAQPIDTIDKVQGVINRFLELYPSETNGKAIAISTYKKQSVNGGFSIMRANSPKGTIELNNVCYPRMKESPYTRLRTALDKIRQNKSLSFDEEYSIESLYHEILHCKAQKWRKLLPHGNGDYKRTAMETVNQFVSRHEYPKFIERLGGKAINHSEVLERGIGYSAWVGNFRGYLKVAKIDEGKAFEYFKDRLLNHRYDSLDNTLAGYIKDNASGALSAFSNNDILVSLQDGGGKWDYVLNLIRFR